MSERLAHRVSGSGPHKQSSLPAADAAGDCLSEGSTGVTQSQRRRRGSRTQNARASSSRLGEPCAADMRWLQT